MMELWDQGEHHDQVVVQALLQVEEDEEGSHEVQVVQLEDKQVDHQVGGVQEEDIHQDQGSQLVVEVLWVETEPWSQVAGH